MIYFTSREIFESILGAIIFGLMCSMLDCIRSIFCTACHKASSALTFIEIIFFGIGFILLSYAFLDGEVRGYMAIIVFASFYLSKMTFLCVFEKILVKLFSLLLIFIKNLGKILSIPFCWFYQIYLTRIVGNKH